MNSTCSPIPPFDPKTLATCGWFTGAGARPGADWACVPVKPSSDYLLNHTLLSAKPPPGAAEQYKGNCRAGNHCQVMRAQQKLPVPYGSIGCVDADTLPDPTGTRFAKYANTL